jgi:uncharacterized protein (UPF0332 family)
MSEFEDFITKGDVKLQGKNEALARALIKSSEKGEKYIKKLKIDNESAEYVVSLVYDIIRELIEAKLLINGYKSYSHEATILFLKRFKEFNEQEIIFLDNLRKIRNGIKYYGKEANKEDALKTLEFMSSILLKLKKLLKNEK